MPMPKSLVAEREDVAQLLLTIRSPSSEAHLVSPTTSVEGKKTQESHRRLRLQQQEQRQQQLKGSAVRWKDLEGNLAVSMSTSSASLPVVPNSDTPTIPFIPMESNTRSIPSNMHDSTTATSASSSSSQSHSSGVASSTASSGPSDSARKIAKLHAQMRRHEAWIQKACKIELAFLNKAKLVREKRNRGVHRLQLLKRQLRQATVEAANSSNNMTTQSETTSGFVLPPVFGTTVMKQSSSIPSKKRLCFVDMTMDDEDDGCCNANDAILNINSRTSCDSVAASS